MIYSKGKSSGLLALKDLFNCYALTSGEVINKDKSTIYSAAIPQARLLLHMVSILNFRITPFQLPRGTYIQR